MIGPYTWFAWGGYAICNAIIPFMRGTDGEPFWLTLIFAPLWGFVFVMAYGRETRGRVGRGGLMFFNTLLALPTVLIFYWVGWLLG